MIFANSNSTLFGCHNTHLSQARTGYLVMRCDGRSSPLFVRHCSQRRRFVPEQLLVLLLLAFQSRLVKGNQRTSTSVMNWMGPFFTVDGYDHPKSQNPICWQEIAVDPSPYYNDTQSSSSFSSPFEDSNNNNAIFLLPSCPNRTNITAHLSMSNDIDDRQMISLPDGTWMGHTNVLYHYKVQGTVDLSQWNATASDQVQIGVSMILCSVEMVRFCSPFVHYQTTTEPNIPLGTLNDGTHINTMVYQVPLVDSYNFAVEVPVQVLEPGVFTVVVGAFFVYPSITSSTTAYAAVQVANVASDFPVICFWNVHVSRPSQLAAHVLIACSGSLILFLLLVAIRNRQSQVLNLTQGKTLIALLVTALIATVSAITFEPKTSLYCNLQGPLIILPLHFLFAILLGRLWRIQILISPMLSLTLERKETWSDNFVEWLRKATDLRRHPSKKSQDKHDRRHHRRGDTSVTVEDSVRVSWIKTILKRNGKNDSLPPPPSTRRSFRRTVTEGQLARVVAIFCFPQIVVQVLYLIFAREQLINGACPTDFFASPTDGFGGVLLLLLVLLLLAMARSAKELPSLFNETEALWDVSLVSLVLLGVALVVIVITHAPTSNPDVRYIVSTLVVVAITTNTCSKIVLPKLRKIWRNEKVVVTKLISDHIRQERSPLVIIAESPDNEREEEEEEEEEGRACNRRNAGSIVLTHILPQHCSNDVASTPFDPDGNDSDESSVVLICHSETALCEPSFLNRAQSGGAESNTMTDTQSLELRHPDQKVIDPFNPCGPIGILQRNSRGLPSRSSFLSTSSTNLPENPPLPIWLNSRCPSFTGSVPKSEPPPSGHRNGGSSQLYHRRAPQTSIVRNRTQNSKNRSSGWGSFLSHNCENTHAAPANKGIGIRFGVFRQKRQSTQLLDLGYNPKKRNQTIRLSVDNPEPPPRRLLLRMIDVHHMLGLLNRAILSGNQATQESWEFLREAVVALGRVFEDEVVFDWELPSEEPYILNVANPAPMSHLARNITC